jgi:hypothetical protein
MDKRTLELAEGVVKNLSGVHPAAAEDIQDGELPDEAPGWSLIELYRKGQVGIEVGWCDRIDGARAATAVAHRNR